MTPAARYDEVTARWARRAKRPPEGWPYRLGSWARRRSLPIIRVLDKRYALDESSTDERPPPLGRRLIGLISPIIDFLVVIVRPVVKVRHACNYTHERPVKGTPSCAPSHRTRAVQGAAEGVGHGTPSSVGRSVRWRRGELLAWLDAGCPSRDRWMAMRTGQR